MNKGSIEIAIEKENDAKLCFDLLAAQRIYHFDMIAALSDLIAAAVMQFLCVSQ